MAKGTNGYKMRTITCASCGETVTGHLPPRRKYCSIECYHKSPKPERRTGEVRACARCGASFYAKRASIEKGGGKFCSLACHNANQGRNKTAHTCKICGETFHWSPSRSASGNYRITYCSLACRDADPERREMLVAMQAIQQLGKMTRAEADGYALLDSMGVEYLRQTPFAMKFTPDAVIPSARLVVQFDGDYWHDRKGTSAEARIMRRVALDKSQDRCIRACGWEVVRLWESELRDELDTCFDRVNQAIHRPLGDAPARDPLARG